MLGLGYLYKLFLKLIGGTRNERIVRVRMQFVREQVNPLEDEMRVRYGRRAWGIPIEVLGSTPNHVHYAARYWAYMLIHDARVRPGGAHARNDMQRKTAHIRRVLEPFRAPGCTWLPYYQPSPFGAVDRDLYVSAWRRPQGDYLLAVAYFGTSPSRIVARVRVKLAGTWRAVNALTQEPCPIRDGELRVPVEFERFRLVHLTPGETNP